MERFFKEIYNFFPKGIAFSDERYKSSSEYLQQLERRKRCKESLGYFQNKIKEALPQYPVINFTNLDEYNCIQFKILISRNQNILDDDIILIKSLGGKRIDLDLYVSALTEGYFCCFRETNFIDNKWFFSNKAIKMEEMVYVESILDGLMKDLNIKKLSHELCSRIVLDVETELLSFGQAKLFNCLFTELEII